jgi:hypothetical protein
VLIGAGISYGGNASLMKVKCLSSSKSCNFFVACGKAFGGGASAGGTVSVGFTFKAKCASDLDGFSFGVDLDAGKGWYGSGGFQIGKKGTVGIHGEGGGGFGASGAFALCYAKKISCGG